MPGPSAQSQTSQTRGDATPEEIAFSGQALRQGNVSGQAAQNALFDPRQRLATLDAEKQGVQARIDNIQAQINNPDNWNIFQANTTAKYNLLKEQLANEQMNLKSLEASKPFLEQQAARLVEQEGASSRVLSRLDDFISGRDLGVSAAERELITQGISGISQDVATTRGLNRSDVPVMQAVAPAVAQSLLAQANANRSLFTGINQFQQGMDLSGKQLQAGLAGQNPAANLTGVYSGLRSSDYSTNSRQGYGTLDYVNAGANLAKGVGSAMGGYADYKSVS